MRSGCVCATIDHSAFSVQSSAFMKGAAGGGRTHTGRGLSPLPLPVGLLRRAGDSLSRGAGPEFGELLDGDRVVVAADEAEVAHDQLLPEAEVDRFAVVVEDGG